MHTAILQFLRDDSGSAVVGEWVFVATILVLAAVAGAATLHPVAADDPDAAAAVFVHAGPAMNADAPATVPDGR
jgi:Flp pilus assembly pilin Flp